MGLEDLSRASGRRGGSSRPPKVNAVVAVQEIVLDKPNVSTPDKDYMVVRLLSPNFGKEAGTVMKARLSEFKKKEGGRDRNSLMDHKRGRGLLKPLVPDNVYVLESAELDSKTGDIMVYWPTKIAAAPEGDPNCIVMPEVYATVKKVRFDSEGKPLAKQARYVLDAANAVRVGGRAMVDGEVALTAEQLQDEAAMQGLYTTPKRAKLDDALLAALRPATGAPGFILRGVMPGNPDVGAAIMWTRRSSKAEDGDRWIDETPEQALASFKEKNPAWIKNVETDQDATYEVIPIQMFNTGRATAEKAQEQVQTAQKGGVRYPTDVTSRRYYATRKDANGEYDASCFALSVMVLNRMEGKDFMFATETRPISAEPEKYFDHEVPTVNLSAELRDAFAAKAAERGKRPPRAPAQSQAPAQQDPEMENAGPTPR